MRTCRLTLLGCALSTALACRPEPQDSRTGSARASVGERQTGPTDMLVLSPVDTLGDTTTWGFPGRMELVGDFLVVADFYATYQMIVVDIRTGKIRGAFGRKGGGPREIQEPELLYVESSDPPQLWTYDSGNRRFSLWAVDRAESAAPLEPIRSLRVNLEGVSHRPFLTADGMIFTTDFGDRVLYIADSAGHVGRTVSELPYEPTEYLYDYIVNTAIPVVDPPRGRIALAYLRTNRVDFYEVTGRHIATGSGPEQVPPLRISRIDGQRRYERPLPMTYGRGSATTSFVYLPYCPKCNTASRPQNYSHVHVFDWAGTFVATLDLGGPSWAIEVSDDDAVLYAAIVDPYPLIVTYPLPEALQIGRDR